MTTGIVLGRRILGEGSEYFLQVNDATAQLSGAELRTLYRALAHALYEQTAEEAIESCAEEEARLGRRIAALKGAVTRAKKRTKGSR